MDQVGFSKEQNISCVAPFNASASVSDSFLFCHCHGTRGPQRPGHEAIPMWGGGKSKKEGWKIQSLEGKAGKGILLTC